MSNIKKSFLILLLIIVSIAGGIMLSDPALPFFASINFLKRTAISDKITGAASEPSITATIPLVASSAPRPDFSETISEVESSVVAVQSFYGGRLLSYGSGIVLTQDGVIATANNIVPPNANIFQIINEGKIYKAKVVFRDYARNVALLVIADSGLQVIKFNSRFPVLGEELIIFSKLIDFDKDNPVVEKAIVSQMDPKTGLFKISTLSSPEQNGGALANKDGEILGIIYFKNQKSSVIGSSILSDTLNAYLARKNL